MRWLWYLRSALSKPGLNFGGINWTELTPRYTHKYKGHKEELDLLISLSSGDEKLKCSRCGKIGERLLSSFAPGEKGAQAVPALLAPYQQQTDRD